jgi:hypothetical protein
MDVMALTVTLFLNFYDEKQEQQLMGERTFEAGMTLAQISTEFRNDINK